MIKRIETHAHSMYSNIRLIDSINQPKDLILEANKIGLQGICLTDHETLSGAVEWLNLEKKLKKEQKIPEDFKCGIGNEIYLIDSRVKNQKYYHYILIAKDTIGFRQLAELSSKSWYQSYYDRGLERVPTLKTELQEIVQKNPGHLIATTACLGGEFPTLVLRYLDALNKNIEIAKSIKRDIDDFILFNINLFHDDFYIEVAPSTSNDQMRFNKTAAKIADFYKVKMIYGTDAHYLSKDMRFVHKAYLNSKEGERETDFYYEFAHLMSNSEAYEYLKECYTYEQFSDMCNNSMEIYNKIIGYDIFHTPIIPHVDVKCYKDENLLEFSNIIRNFNIDAPVLKSLFSSSIDQERYWVNQCFEALKKRKLIKKEYFSRLEIEADIIKTVGEKLNNCLFEYFNTFQSLIELFWECDSIVGPGRGSSVCFLSNFLLGITQLNPLEWDLMEWRFLNKDRLELPDIDIDLSPSKRPLILKKIRELRGETRVLQVATFGTEGTKSAILAACRGYRSDSCPNGIDVDEAQYISGLIPQERGFLWELKEVVYGNPDKDRKPIKQFIEETDKYPGLLDIMFGIEGLVNKRSQHASGVILYNEDPWNTGALMKSPNGDLITQFSLGDAEELGDTKFDFLVTSICDKIINTITLLKKDGYFNSDLSLKEIYNQYLHPSVIDLNEEQLWDTLASGKVLSLFQFDTDVGGQAIKAIKPRNPYELMMANALTRLMGERGKERPIDRYVRLKNDISQWYKECNDAGLAKEEIDTLSKYYLQAYGTPTTQERLMLLCMEPKLAHFTLSEANYARKICAKKKLSEIPALKEKFISQCPNRTVGEYVWRTAIEPQMSYAFAEPHALAYSYVAIQTLVLVTHYPVIYWNCGCLITDSGSDEYINSINEEENDGAEEEIVDIYEPEEWEEYDYEDLPDRSGKKKKKITTVDYGKVATAIGKFKTEGIEVTLPDINESGFTFTPNVAKNTIAYGLKGITRISNDIVNTIMANRPYDSLADFCERVKLNKLQMVALIKSGAFDNIEAQPREEILADYVDSVSDKKSRLTLQNMPGLITYDLIPQEMEFYKKLFLFNKFLKKQKQDGYYMLNDAAINFIDANYNCDILTNGNSIEEKKWDNIYKKAMDPMRDYLKAHKDEMLEQLNRALFMLNWNKYGRGNVSSYEMESVGFYAGKHELDKCDMMFDNFYQLPEEPVVEYQFPAKDGGVIQMYRLNLIGGTVIDKNKMKNTVTLLTQYGVVTVKIYKNQFAVYDKQLSERQPDGTKKIVERSWFKRGTMLMIQGIRREQNFIPKKYKSSVYPVISKITEIKPDGTTIFQYERMDVEAE